MTSIHRDRAFTLVELIVALILGAIVITAIFYGAVYFFGQVSRAEELAQLHDEADVASRWIEQNTREGTWAYLTSSDGDTVVAENYRNGTLQWDSEIYPNGGELLVRTGGDTTKAASDLESVTFRVYPSRIAYELVMRRNQVQYSMNSSVRLRNPSFNGIWHFTRANDRIAYDSSSFRNHALITGCEQMTPAGWEYGEVLSFGGSATGDHLRVPSNPGLDTEGQVCVSAWVRLSSSAASDIGGGSTLTILNRNGEGVKPGGFLHFYMEANQLCYAFCESGPSSVVRAFSDDLTWEADRWYQVMVQHNQRGNEWVNFYRDGKLVGEQGVVAMQPVTAGDMLMGAYESGGNLWGTWDGEMDEIRYSTF